jgi:hypothetical protein
MQDLKTTLTKKYQLVSIDINNNLNISTDISSKLNDIKLYDNDYLFVELNDLVNEQYRAWYMSAFYKLGKDLVLKLASIARADGKNQPRYFSYLIKQELQNGQN